jgi:hypothetical protein
MACIIASWVPTTGLVRVSAETVGQVLDPGHALVAAFGDDIGSPELKRQLLPRLVPTHRDDPHYINTHRTESLLGARVAPMCATDSSPPDRARLRESLMRRVLTGHPNLDQCVVQKSAAPWKIGSVPV